MSRTPERVGRQRSSRPGGCGPTRWSIDNWTRSIHPTVHRSPPRSAQIRATTTRRSGIRCAAAPPGRDRTRSADRGYDRVTMRLRFVLFGALWLAAGCSASGSDPTASPAGGGPTGATGTPPATGAIALPASIVAPVVEEIARVAGVPVERVTVLSARAMTFPDAGLGCPEPGMVYAQVLVDGWRIVAEAGGTTF